MQKLAKGGAVQELKLSISVVVTIRLGERTGSVAIKSLMWGGSFQRIFLRVMSEHSCKLKLRVSLGACLSPGKFINISLMIFIEYLSSV